MYRIIITTSITHICWSVNYKWVIWYLCAPTFRTVCYTALTNRYNNQGNQTKSNYNKLLFKFLAYAWYLNIASMSVLLFKFIWNNWINNWLYWGLLSDNHGEVRRMCVLAENLLTLNQMTRQKFKLSCETHSCHEDANDTCI